MIESLELHNWRSYEQLELKLQPGVTFIVAPNGVGKSSIIEGARFALYGNEPSRGGHRKADAVGQTSAAVTLRLDGDSTLRINRVMAQRKNATPVTTAELDGEELDSEALNEVLRARFGAPLAVLDRLSMIHGSEVVGSSQPLDLRVHLSDFLGVSGLDRALVETGELLKEAEAEVKRHRAASEVSRDELRRQEALAEQAKSQLAEIEERVTAAQAHLNEARAATRESERAGTLVARANERDAKLRALADDAEGLVGSISDVEELSQALADADERLRNQLDANRRRRAELDGRIAAATAQLVELNDATGTCPVCRRPLDPADVATARESHEAEIAAWTAERAAIVDDALNRRLDAIARARSVLAQLGPALEIPSGAPELDVAQSAEAVAASAYEAVANGAVLARAEAHQAIGEFESATTAASALDAVTHAYATQATLEATRDALARTRASLLEQGIEPLAESLDMHWSQLFRNRPGLLLAGNGGMTRTVGKAALVSSQFSDGERMVAQLLLRLLVLKATTRLPFMWIDEPLEHLDPDTRRALSLLLATAPFSDSAGLRQVVMTTYEEPLVRRLRAAIPNTHVRYVLGAA
jgi:DNA repair exonuclease SbcCD ATPase subunit